MAFADGSASTSTAVAVEGAAETAGVETVVELVVGEVTAEGGVGLTSLGAVAWDAGAAGASDVTADAR